jgi:hypothetical protein
MLLLVDTAREIHGRQGLFEEAGEFPGTSQVNLRVSADADQHKRFGRSFLYQYLSFRVATSVERASIIPLPLAQFCSPVALPTPGGPLAVAGRGSLT